MTSTPLRDEAVQTAGLSAPVLAILILRRLHAILRISLVLALITVAVLLVLPRRWVAGGSLVPESRRLGSDLTSLSGLAAQFGVAVGGQNAPPSAFYATLLTSHAILGAVVDHNYTINVAGEVNAGALPDVYRVSGNTPALRREQAIKRLSHDLHASFDLRTGIVGFQVSARSPDLALQIAEQTLAELTRFNMSRRQTEAASERVFTETRREEVRGELRDAEDRLQRFLQSNRDYRNSPGLVFEFERLSREVGLRQEIYSSVSQAYEQARIEEVRDTPVFTVIDPPRLPVSPERRGIWWKATLAFLFGAGLAVTGILVREAVLPTPETDVPAALSGLWNTTVRDLRRPWRLLRARTRDF